MYWAKYSIIPYNTKSVVLCTYAVDSNSETPGERKKVAVVKEGGGRASLERWQGEVISATRKEAANKSDMTHLLTGGREQRR
jgi:hypothetical protein